MEEKREENKKEWEKTENSRMCKRKKYEETQGKREGREEERN